MTRHWLRFAFTQVDSSRLSTGLTVKPRALREWEESELN